MPLTTLSRHACVSDETLEKFIFISFQRIENNIVILIENSDRVKKTLTDQFESPKITRACMVWVLVLYGMRCRSLVDS